LTQGFSGCKLGQTDWSVYKHMAAEDELETKRKKQILDAAERVFSKHGFDKARVDDIVEESGLSKGALYWYYKSKDAIIRALLERVFISEMREAEELVKAEGSAADRLALFVKFAVREYRRFENLLPLAYEFVALAYRNETVRETVVGYFKHYASILAEVIQQGINSGEFRDCNPKTTAISLIAMYEGTAMLWFLDRDSVNWDQMAKQPLEMFLSGLSKEDR
jgi:AcrR family transcriptional regulator